MRYFTIVLLAVSAVAQVSALPVHQNGLALRHDLEARYYADDVYHTLHRRAKSDQPTSGKGKPKPKPKPDGSHGSGCCTVMRREHGWYRNHKRGKDQPTSGPRPKPKPQPKPKPKPVGGSKRYAVMRRDEPEPGWWI